MAGDAGSSDERGTKPAGVASLPLPPAPDCCGNRPSMLPGTPSLNAGFSTVSPFRGARRLPNINRLIVTGRAVRHLETAEQVHILIAHLNDPRVAALAI